jgi:hypothetical protein
MRQMRNLIQFPQHPCRQWNVLCALLILWRQVKRAKLLYLPISCSMQHPNTSDQGFKLGAKANACPNQLIAGAKTPYGKAEF